MARSVYIASKTKHAPEWRRMREAGARIISTWIDEAGPGESKILSDLALRCIKGASTADFLLLYSEPGEILKGALWEAGAALGAGKFVAVLGESLTHSEVLCSHPMAFCYSCDGYASVETVLRRLGCWREVRNG